MDIKQRLTVWEFVIAELLFGNEYGWNEAVVPSTRNLADLAGCNIWALQYFMEDELLKYGVVYIVDEAGGAFGDIWTLKYEGL